MLMTVREALKVGKLKEGIVVAGKEGLDRTVSYVDIMEVPDVSRWIRSEELLLTTGYAIKDSLELQQQLILELAQKRAAGIIIKINRFLESIPDCMIDLANNYNIPIIQLPPDIPYIEITHALYKQILMKQNEERWKSERLKVILYSSKNNDISILIKQLKEINKNFDFNHPFVIIVIHCDKNDIFEKCVNMNHIRQMKDVIYAWIDSNFVLMYPVKTKQNWQQNIIENILKNKSVNQSNNDFICIISKIINRSKLNNICSIYSHLISAIDRKNYFAKNKNVFFFDQIVHYAYIDKISKLDISSHFIEYILDPLDSLSDTKKKLLINTLHAYVKAGGNISKAARTCFVHRNTFLYRMQKIKKIFNNNLDSCEEIFKYRLAIELYKMLNKD